LAVKDSMLCTIVAATVILTANHSRTICRPTWYSTPSFQLRFITLGKARRGQGELLWAVGGLWGVVADGELDRTAHNIAMIR